MRNIHRYCHKIYYGYLLSCFFSFQTFAACPIVGKYWAFSPCTSKVENKDNIFYETKGGSYRKKMNYTMKALIVVN
jgi:hypothetical protein